MDFTNLDSKETLTAGLNWIAENVQGAMLNHEKHLWFTFTPNEQNTIEDIFNFVLKLKENLAEYSLFSWVVLDNENSVVRMKVLF